MVLVSCVAEDIFGCNLKQGFWPLTIAKNPLAFFEGAEVLFLVFCLHFRLSICVLLPQIPLELSALSCINPCR